MGIGNDKNNNNKNTNTDESFSKIVRKINSSSFIITTMNSFAQIVDFSSYFLRSNLPMDDKKISGDFKNYIENLNDKSDEIFIPKDYMIRLNKIFPIFSLKEELDPYIYYKSILEKLNDELNVENSEINGENSEINEYFNNILRQYKENTEIKEFLKKFIKKNNSIISKTFYGIMKETESCNFCCGNEKTDYHEFNIIDINVNDFCNSKHLEGDSLSNFYLDDCIEYFFEEKNLELDCEKCQQKRKKRIERKIIELPNYLVIRINWGKFINNKGFSCQLDYIEPSYEYLEIDEIIEIKNDYCAHDSCNDNNKIPEPINYQLLSTIDYFINDNKKLEFISKYRIKKEGKSDRWYNFWCNGKGKEKGTYIDHFTTPCLLFYKKI